MIDCTSVFESVNKQAEKNLVSRRNPVEVRLWDGNWHFMGDITRFYELEFDFKNLDAGTANLQIPLDHPLAELLVDPTAWPTKSIYVTFDKDGARWSGRLENSKVHVDYRDQRHLELSFIHDYVKLKELLVWANPFLPAEIQFPKAWMLFGPSRWVVTSTLFVNLLRKNNSLWMIPDDPLNIGQWFDLDMSNWNIAVKPVDFMTDRSLTAVVSSRFKYFHDCVVDVCADAELTIECRRYLPGDPPPIPGKNLRYGCLVVEVVDKSGWNAETAVHGNIFSGLVRGIRRIASDGLTEGLDYVTKPTQPAEYQQAQFRGTVPEAPWVVLEHGEYTGVESTEFEYTPPGPSQFVTGGSSMAGVNEAIKASIIGIGGMLGSTFAGQAQLGAVAEAVLEPLYSDVFMAFMAHKDHQRISKQGWDYPFEYWVSGADRAYSLAAITSLRTARLETGERYACMVKMLDGSPYFVGPRGFGDFFMGDRVAVHALGMPKDKLFIERVEGLSYSDNGKEAGWEIEIGKPDFKSGISFLAQRYENLTGGLRDLSVW